MENIIKTSSNSTLLVARVLSQSSCYLVDIITLDFSTCDYIKLLIRASKGPKETLQFNPNPNLRDGE